MPVELGGGIRDLKTVDRLINKGISRVILGSAALRNPQMVREAVRIWRPYCCRHRCKEW